MFEDGIKKDKTDGIVILLYKSVAWLHWKHWIQDAHKCNQTKMFLQKWNGNDQNLKNHSYFNRETEDMKYIFLIWMRKRGKILMVH